MMVWEEWVDVGKQNEMRMKDVTNKLTYWINYSFLFPFRRCYGSEQSFRVRPVDVEVKLGDTAIIQCEVDNQAGQTQWTRGGFALGKHDNNYYFLLFLFSFKELHRSLNFCFRKFFQTTAFYIIFVSLWNLCPNFVCLCPTKNECGLRKYNNGVKNKLIWLNSGVRTICIIRFL